MKKNNHHSNANIELCESIHQRFASSAEIHASKTAVSFGEEIISYAELVQRADAFAHHLISIGAGGNNLMAISMDRTPDMIVAIFGVWMAGSAFIPLDPDYPECRLQQMLEDALPLAIITDRSNKHKMGFHNFERIVFDDLAECDSPLQSTSDSMRGNLAYVIYTSGSTGKPKGVEVSHSALCNFMTAIQDSLCMEPIDAMAAITTICFDISIMEIVLPLMHGATVVLVDKSTSHDGIQLAAELEIHNVTFMQATPATWRLLLDSKWQGKDDLTVICGGEKFPRALAEELLIHCDSVFNVYGPTEATIWSTIAKVKSGSGSVPIGKPLRNHQAHVLDEKLTDVINGEVGQLYLGGNCLANGYLNQPQETAKQFITHPLYGRLYASGDLVRQMVDGDLEYVGRNDNQIKINGFRIELGDIESHLLTMKNVKESLVILQEDEAGIKKMVAYLVANNSDELISLEIRNALRGILPNYMIPHYFVQLDRFPLTLNNKIDRNQLPAPQAQAAPLTTPPINPLEAYLQSVWIEVLGIETICVTDNFFELGGDSLQAARIMNQIQEWLGELLWPVIIFDAPTICQLANYLSETYPQAVGRKLTVNNIERAQASDRTIDHNLIAEFKALTPHIAPARYTNKKNPPAIFILCSPRSGSTLLRVMLTGHPGIFAPPELELLTFNNMQERVEIFSGRESYRLEGTIRAVMEIKNCGIQEARSYIEFYEKNLSSIAEFYGVLQNWLNGRVLVDKTPANCLDLFSLQRIEQYFDKPLYIHLTRHPHGMIHSFMDARLSEVFFRRTQHNFSARELAELIWLACNENACTALKSVPLNRQFTLSYETLTAQPSEIIDRLCEFLGVEFYNQMLEPHLDREGKMTDGIHPESKMMGDPKFHQHQGIDASNAKRWQESLHPVNLGKPASGLARQLGYSDLDESNPTDEREKIII